MGIDQLVTGGDVDDPVVDSLAADSVNTESVESESVNTDDTDTKRLSDDYHYAGSYDGSDQDARLDNAILAANIGDVIQLENNSFYSDDRTISKRLRISGTIGNEAGGTRITGDWTFDDRLKLTYVNMANGTLTLNNKNCTLFNIGAANHTVTVAANNCNLSVITGGSITFNSGTSGGLIDTSIDVSVTDNGNNTVGDIT